MVTNGFTCGFSDAVTLDAMFLHISSYIYVSGAAGNIVFENSSGTPQFLPAASLGYHPIAARRILSAGTVNGVARTTTAVGIGYLSSSAS